MRMLALALLLATAPALADIAPPATERPTVVNDQDAAERLVGRHKLSLQWISWDVFGVATITKRDDRYYLKGEQKKGEDYLTIDGIITVIDEKTFDFDGTVVTRVQINNQGQPCTRKGKLQWKISGKRKYWRLVQMDNPCEGVTDYVDIYFKK